ncbi:hypothetical protein TorRG33x02_145310 [Trema orientale]|uniref:Uncharacterized protein n=1 Tax=Trema orientale TaxID=63057 RepID=A0A2P5EVX9_TREOI|nr:hypothetical protein TorRG33x02_145310 [Trema orientale]
MTGTRRGKKRRWGSIGSLDLENSSKRHRLRCQHGQKSEQAVDDEGHGGGDGGGFLVGNEQSDVSQSAERLGLGRVIEEMEDGGVLVEEGGGAVVEELEGEDEVFGIGKDELLDGDRVSGIGKDEVLALGDFS